MTVAVDVTLDMAGPGGDGAIATVRPRRRGPSRSAGGPERFKGEGADEALGLALRRSRLLRTLRTVDLRVILETADVVLHVRAGQAPVGAAPDGFVAPVTVPLGAERGALEVALGRDLLDDVIEGLGRRRTGGTVRLDLGPLVRARALLDRVASGLGRRPGVVVDLSRAALTVMELDGADLVRVRAVPAADPRNALRQLAGPSLRRAVERARTTGSEPWLHLAVPDALDGGVRSACAALLPPGTAIDLVRSVGAHRDPHDR